MNLYDSQELTSVNTPASERKSLYYESGFTVFELVAGFAMFVTILAVAIPNFSEISSSFNRYNGANQFEFDVRRARAEAISRGARGVLSLTNGGSAYSFGFDDLPFNDPAAADTVFFQRELPTLVTAGSTEAILFDSRGNLIDADGVLSTATISVSHHGSKYCSGTIYSAGNLELDCNE